MLGTNKDGSFKYNKNNKLPDNSIFVIDEASMIDICLFAALFEAIPTSSKVFILGDKNQLPSVESGAVFGELLKMDILKDNKIELDESIRFSKDSMIYQLADEINDDRKKITLDKWEEADKFNIEPTDSNKCPVYLYKYDLNTKYRLTIDKIIQNWAMQFYVRLQKASCDLDINDIEVLDKLFEMSKDAKILCAENEGYRGVKYINNAIKKRYVIDEFKGIYLKEYPGLLMMVNTNNDFLHLYNGDSGILVAFKGDETIYFMLDSIHPRIQNEGYNKGTMFRLGKYTFYPITSLKSDEVDLAFAITIHKSQGSDYNNILVILPNRMGHPLLNKQIIYTAITRTKGNTYIIASKERLEEAKKNFIERDTNIA
ncbi:MAG: AAA family ATPase [Bacilli bacterium]|nr:AAA family ATPase [Bacilli bacterium]